MSLKIAYFVKNFPVVTETFVVNQIQGIIDRGHEVNIYSLRGGGEGTLSMREKTTYLDTMPPNYVVRLITLASLFIRMRGWRYFPVIARSLNFLRYGREAASLQLCYYAITLIPQQSYDIIHCQFGVLAPLVVRLKTIGAIRGQLVISFRGYDATVVPRKNPGIYDEVFKQGDLFLPVSESLAGRITELGCRRDRIEVLHTGIDCTIFPFLIRDKQANSPVNILSIGRLTEKKGFEYGILAIHYVMHSGRDVRYKLIGEGDLLPNLKELIREKDLERFVAIEGWKKHHEIIDEMQKADILLAPSLTSRDDDMEGIPNVLKEAMALGIPVVSTYHSGIPELVRDGISGYLVPERDWKSLADKIIYLIDNAQNRERMCTSARQIVESEFDLSTQNQKLESMYMNLIRNRDSSVRPTITVSEEC